MKRISSRLLFAVCAAAALSAFEFHAQAQTIYTVIPGSAPAAIPSIANGDFIRVFVEADSSYCCQAAVAVDQQAIFFSSSSLALTHADGSSTITGSFRGADVPRLLNGQGRLCFTVPAGLLNPSVVLTLGTTAAINNAILECLETTLFGGFNTSVTDFNFLEITNTMPQTLGDARGVTAALKIVNVIPDPDVILANNETLSLPAATRTDVNVHERTGEGRFGTIRLTHDGAPGTIRAVLSQYNITSTAPFTFAPVAQEVLTTRAEMTGGR